VFQYAGYLLEDGGVLGDRKNLELTRSAAALGWSPPDPPSPFDLLPLVLRAGSGRRLLYEVPARLAREVEIAHPDHPGLASLSLRWYAIPCVSNMVLTIGGIDYPCAPFAGWYMATEIASRDLADVRRYDLLPKVAAALGLDLDGDPLWQDRALTELNRAVLWSFERAGAAITDHHAASRQYMEFVKQEQAAGRVPSGDWSWIVPPQASSACPVYHLPMEDKHRVPNYYASRAEDGGALTLDRSLERRNRWRRRLDRLKRRIRNWRRQRDWAI
jgi:nitric-oxide synthase